MSPNQKNPIILNYYSVMLFICHYIIIGELSDDCHKIFDSAIHHLRDIHTSGGALALKISKKSILTKIITLLHFKQTNQISICSHLHLYLLLLLNFLITLNVPRIISLCPLSCRSMYYSISPV